MASQCLTYLLDLLPPDNHLAASPDCRMKFSRNRRTGGAGSCPTISAGIVSSARVQIAAKGVQSAPDHHFTASPDSCVTVSGVGRVRGSRGCPTVRARIVSPARRVSGPTPDD